MVGENIVFIDAGDCIERVDEGRKKFDNVFCDFDRIAENDKLVQALRVERVNYIQNDQ